MYYCNINTRLEQWTSKLKGTVREVETYYNEIVTSGLN